jgi:hypothetical protein
MVRHYRRLRNRQHAGQSPSCLSRTRGDESQPSVADVLLSPILLPHWRSHRQRREVSASRQLRLHQAVKWRGVLGSPILHVCIAARDGTLHRSCTSHMFRKSNADWDNRTQTVPFARLCVCAQRAWGGVQSFGHARDLQRAQLCREVSCESQAFASFR